MRIALFGGTFDPIHRGHLVIASAAARAFSLDRVVFAPTGRQPLKADPPAAAFLDRMEMVALALDGHSVPGCDFVLSGLDAPRPDGEPNFTVDALSALALELPSAELWAVAGADSFLSLRRWREPDRLLELAQWIVVSRPGIPLTPDPLHHLALTDAQRARVHLLQTVHEDISATELRRRLSHGDPCTDWLPPPVADYIRRLGLYRHNPETVAHGQICV